MSFPPGFLDELRLRLPLSEITGKRLRLVRAGREFKACCPFHHEKTPSFYINDDKQFFHCFGCGAHGDIIGFTMRHDGLSFPDAIEALANLAGLPVPQDTPIEREKFDKEKRLYQIVESATLWFEAQLLTAQGQGALHYLRARGLTNEAIKRHRLGYAPADAQAIIQKLVGEGFKLEEMIEVGLIKKSEKNPNQHYSFFRDRVIFPVGDRKGRMVAFGARVLDGGEPKYLNSPDHPLFHKGKMLYGLSRARAAIAQNQPLIVVEGYMDVIAMVEAGYSGAVAPLGTALTADQLMALWKLLPSMDSRDPARDYSPILCFDGDGAGQRAQVRAVDRALPLLTIAQTIRIAVMPSGLDPDDVIKKSGKAGMNPVLEQAKQMIDALWDIALAGRRMATPEDRGAFMGALRGYVAKMSDENLRRLYGEEIKKRFDSAFGWNAGKSSPSGAWGNRRDGRFSQRGQAPLVPVNRRQPPSAKIQWERGLLAIMVNHPALFEEFGENLAQIAFSNPAFEVLRQKIVEILGQNANEPLDAKELYRHLCEEGGEGENILRLALAEVLSEPTYIHASFARASSPQSLARAGWLSIWNKHLQEQLHLDLEQAKKNYAEDASDNNLNRLFELRRQIVNAQQDSDSDIAQQAI